MQLVTIIIIISFCLCVLYVITARHNIAETPQNIYMYSSNTNEVLNNSNNVLSYNCNIGVGQEWQNTIPEGLTSIHLDLGE